HSAIAAGSPGPLTYSIRGATRASTRPSIFLNRSRAAASPFQVFSRSFGAAASKRSRYLCIPATCFSDRLPSSVSSLVLGSGSAAREGGINHRDTETQRRQKPSEDVFNTVLSCFLCVSASLWLVSSELRIVPQPERPDTRRPARRRVQ